jgi:hypothetical protein
VSIEVEEFDDLKAWLARIVDRAAPMASPGSDADPIAILDRMNATSPTKAKRGLSLAINDMVEMTAGWTPSQVASTDEEFRAAGLPTLSAIRLRFSAQLRRVIRRGRIKTRVEYYAVRNAAQTALNEQKADLLQLLTLYEEAEPSQKKRVRG